MRNKFISLVAGLAFVLSSPTPLLRADDGWDRAVLTLIEENDSGLSDKDYTQGAQFIFLSPDRTPGSFVKSLPSVRYDAVRWKAGFEGGHLIFTPEDIKRSTLIRDDRPYAGWAYGGLIFQQRGTNAGGSGVMETARIQVGVVGPDSQADDIQIWWHKTFGFQRPNGWEHQLKNELGVQFGYDRRHLYKFGQTWSTHLIPEAGVALGNIRTDAHLGGVLRLGYNIPNEFGLEKSGRKFDFGVYLFGSVRGQAVALDIFLDGNNFRESHDVKKCPFLAEGRVGIVFATRYAELALTHVRRTREFEGQNLSDGFNSVTWTAKF
jgi:lipid A 3-O-deacylase